jgi:hypothetical protein
MKSKLTFILVLFLVLLLSMPLVINADTGPKPSVVISFEGLENEKYYVTLLSDTPTTGPYSVYDENSDPEKYNGVEDKNNVWKKFISYKDEDGYYFLQYFDECTETSKFIWGYYPPSKFKILIYFPDHDSFAVSNEVYERYAFDSYYKVDASGMEIQSVTLNNNIQAQKNYPYSWELISLISRILITIIIEVLIALLFGFREKKLLLIVLVTNIITQSILNILLNLINYYQGGLMFVLNYIWMELLVIVIEAVAYCILFNKYSKKVPIGKFKVSTYAFIANVVSFCSGLLIAGFIPSLF